MTYTSSKTSWKWGNIVIQWKKIILLRQNNHSRTYIKNMNWLNKKIQKCLIRLAFTWNTPDLILIKVSGYPSRWLVIQYWDQQIFEMMISEYWSVLTFYPVHDGNWFFTYVCRPKSATISQGHVSLGRKKRWKKIYPGNGKFLAICI